MAGAGTQGPDDSGTLRLTWVTDHLAHVIDGSEFGGASGTWTGLAVPAKGCGILVVCS